MPDAATVVADLYAWSLRFGILTGSGMREAALSPGGDAKRVPFGDEEAEFFRMRKIMRIRAENEGAVPRVTIFTRQVIAQQKVLRLSKLFADANGDVNLVIAVSPVYRIDQTLQSYGPFEPLRIRDDRVVCGSSVGLGNQRNAGTLTALARSVETGALFGMSCNHVVGGCSTAQPGIPVVVPGIQDVTVDFSQITVVGTHYAAATMIPGLPTVLPDISTNGDLACFELNDAGRQLLTSWQGVGPDSYDTPTTFVAGPVRGLEVQKWGRSTGYTKGTIASVLNDPFPIEYDVTSYFGPQNSQVFRGTIYFQSVFEVAGRTGRPFSVAGDSGALVVTADPATAHEVVGIVVAGSSGKSLVLPLAPLLQQLNLELVSGFPAAP